MDSSDRQPPLIQYEILASIFESPFAGSLRTFSVQNDRHIGMKRVDSLIRHHNMSIETLL